MDVEDRTAEAVGGSHAEGDDTNPNPDTGKPDTGAPDTGKPDTGAFDVNEILDEYGLNSADELKEFIGNMKNLEGQIGDNDLEELVENSNTLKKFQREWAKQEREKLKDNETPEETIARLEKENEDLQHKSKKEREQIKASQTAKKAIEAFGSTVNNVIETGDVPKSWQKHIAEFMGVGNPINEVDIEDKAVVRKLTKEGIKKMNAFAQLVIQEYRNGKVQIPAVTTTQTPPSDTNKPKGAKNLREARRIMHESMSAIFKR